MWEGIVLNLFLELGIICLICTAGEEIAALLPFALPASVISLILLLILLLTGVIREHSIEVTSRFFIGNMGLFFIPAIVGTLEYLDILKTTALPFLVITLISTPVVYCITAWSVCLFMKLFRKKETPHD